MKNVVKVNEFFIFKIFTEFVGSRWIYADWEKKLPNFKVQNAIFWMSNVRRTYNSNLITAIFFTRNSYTAKRKLSEVHIAKCISHIPSAPILNPRRFPAWFSGYFLPVLSQNIYPRYGGMLQKKLEINVHFPSRHLTHKYNEKKTENWREREFIELLATFSQQGMMRDFFWHKID